MDLKAILLKEKGIKIFVGGDKEIIEKVYNLLDQENIPYQILDNSREHYVEKERGIIIVGPGKLSPSLLEYSIEQKLSGMDNKISEKEFKKILFAGDLIPNRKIVASLLEDLKIPIIPLSELNYFPEEKVNPYSKFTKADFNHYKSPNLTKKIYNQRYFKR